MILITGSTGGFGTSTINFLIDNGFPPADIAALARNEGKTAKLREFGVEVRPGDYDDYPSLVKAFTGIEKLLFISGSEIGKRDKQHENIVKAARQASVQHIIYTSFDRKDDREDSPIAMITHTHILTEKMIIESGLKYTFMRNALYAEGLPMFLGKDVLERGIYLPAGDGKVPFASRTDMAEAAANIMAESGHENKSYRTVNLKNYSFYEIAEILSKLTGRQIKYFCPEAGDYKNTLINAGVPKEAVGGLIAWFEGIRQGYFESSYSDMEELLGRKPADLKTILSKIY
jgi:NAD(P)H dehydrogenase (quinone)